MKSQRGQPVIVVEQSSLLPLFSPELGNLLQETKRNDSLKSICTKATPFHVGKEYWPNKNIAAIEAPPVLQLGKALYVISKAELCFNCLKHNSAFLCIFLSSFCRKI